MQSADSFTSRLMYLRLWFGSVRADSFTLPSKSKADRCEAPLAKYAVTIKEVASFQKTANARSAVATCKMVP